MVSPSFNGLVEGDFDIDFDNEGRWLVRFLAEDFDSEIGVLVAVPLAELLEDMIAMNKDDFGVLVFEEPTALATLKSIYATLGAALERSEIRPTSV